MWLVLTLVKCDFKEDNSFLPLTTNSWNDLQNACVGDSFGNLLKLRVYNSTKKQNKTKKNMHVQTCDWMTTLIINQPRLFFFSTFVFSDSVGQNHKNSITATSLWSCPIISYGRRLIHAERWCRPCSEEADPAVTSQGRFLWRKKKFCMITHYYFVFCPSHKFTFIPSPSPALQLLRFFFHLFL